MATRAVADEAPAERGPGGPTGGVLRRPIKCHVTATTRETCIANKSSAVDQMGEGLATINMGRKLGGVPPFSGGGLGPHLIQCRLRVQCHIGIGGFNGWPHVQWPTRPLPKEAPEAPREVCSGGP